ncbi:MAG: LLM class flavin-dependent oxidoreductase [Acidimicrobiales bacterium]
MLLDVLIDPFGATWAQLRDAALAAEGAGFDGVWTWDHLAGSVHRATRVPECWTVLSALAPLTSRVSLGPMVANVANRPPGTLAVMAATLQEVCGGRLILGLGAGGGLDTPYAAEQLALSRTVPGAAVRRRQVEESISVLRAVWSGSTGGVAGFTRPEPVPPIVVGAFGPKMAALAGRAADGINCGAGPGLPPLVEVARRARAEAGLDAEPFLVTASASLDRRWLDANSAYRRRAEEDGVSRLVMVGSPAEVIDAARRGSSGPSPWPWRGRTRANDVD